MSAYQTRRPETSIIKKLGKAAVSVLYSLLCCKDTDKKF